MSRSRGFVYILHFHTPLSTGRKSSQHYIGFTRRWYWRMQEHRAGRGARIMAVCADRGIAFDIAAVCTHIECGGVTYTGRAAERQLKRSHAYRRYCPLCGGHGAVDYRLELQAAGNTEEAAHESVG